MRANCRQLAAIALAVLAMAAAPPRAETGGPSFWSRVVERAKAMAHNPFGRERRDADREKSTERVRVARPPDDAAVHPSVRQPSNSQDGVRQASASRPIASPPAQPKPAAPASKWTSWFSRGKRHRRTLSEYMAQEKP